MANILITGANGQLGSEFKQISGLTDNHFIFTDINELDITDNEAVNIFFKSRRIDFIINCAAYTAVDKAENEQEQARLINVKAVENISHAAKENNCYLIHISTDYVFDGKNYKPYIEEDMVSPQSVYGKTKLEGEKIMESYAKGLIIRTSWLYSSFGHNFVKTMLRMGKERGELNVVFDQIGTPTYAADLAGAILEIIKQTITNSKKIIPGIYHYSNEGVCSWYDFSKEIMDLDEINCKVNPIESKDYPTPAKRPFYSVLNKEKIKSVFGIEIPYWKDSLNECIKLIKNGMVKK